MSAQRRRIISTSTQAKTGKTRDSFRARRDLKVRQVPKESLAPKATPETLELKAQKATLAISVPRDQRETPALRARRDLKVRQVPRESLDLRVTPGTSAPRDPREIQDLKARQVPKGRQAQKVRMAR